MNQVKLIGRVEKIDFPVLGLVGIDAKVDTGAYSCAIHCYDIVENSDEKSLRFKLLDPTHPEFNDQEFVFFDYTKTVVKSSIGNAECRFKIKTSVQLGDDIYKSSFTLSDRSNMKYPVLLGRKLLNKRFIVDVSQNYLLTKKSK